LRLHGVHVLVLEKEAEPTRRRTGSTPRIRTSSVSRRPSPSACWPEVGAEIRRGCELVGLSQDEDMEDLLDRAAHVVRRRRRPSALSGGFDEDFCAFLRRSRAEGAGAP
jgi:energy-coupling factor transporter ATP-binding protein EcfA2